jgi:hypothetical protein
MQVIVIEVVLSQLAKHWGGRMLERRKRETISQGFMLSKMDR